MENELAKAGKEKRDRANKICELRREVTQLRMLRDLRMLQVKYYSLACHSRSGSKEEKVMSSTRSIFSTNSEDDSNQKFVSRASTEMLVSSERPSSTTIVSCPCLDDELNYPSSETCKEREVASLQREISILEAESKYGESQVVMLQQHLSQLSSTADMLLTGIGQKTKNYWDKAYIEELKKNLPKIGPRDAIRSNARSQVNRNVLWEEKHQQHESLVLSTSSGSRVPSTPPGSRAAFSPRDTLLPIRKGQSTGNKWLLDYNSFRLIEPSVLKTKAISFIL